MVASTILLMEGGGAGLNGAGGLGRVKEENYGTKIH